MKCFDLFDFEVICIWMILLSDYLQTVSQKKQTIGQRCIACGYNGMVDMRHKLTPFILKNPPDMVRSC